MSSSKKDHTGPLPAVQRPRPVHTMKTMARDADRQRSYDAEYEAFEETSYESPLGLHALELLTAKICATPWWRENSSAQRVLIKEAHPAAKTSSASRAKGEIRIAHGMDTIATLCHELAHIAANDAHGPVFRAAMVELIRLVAGQAPASRLEKIYRAKKLAIGAMPPAPALDLASALLPSNPESEPHTRKIKALLAKAESTSPEEADALRTKALQLSFKHGVSLASLAKESSVSPVMVERKIRIGAGPYVAARSSLLFALARSRCCETMWVNDALGRVVSVLGHACDADEVVMLFASLDHQARAELLKETPTGNTLRFRRSWLSGFANAVDNQLRKAERSATSPATRPSPQHSTTSLVLKERREKAREYRDSLYPRLHSVRSSTRSERAAYSLGASSGAKARVTPQSPIASPRPALPPAK